MTIRPAERADAARMRQLILSAMEPQRREEFSEEGWQTFQDYNTVSAIRHRQDDERRFTLLAFLEDELVGLISMLDFSEIDQLFVGRDFQDQGVATELWNIARRHCEQQGGMGYYWVRSSVIAVPVYESLGFRRQGRRENENGMMHYLMTAEAQRKAL